MSADRRRGPRLSLPARVVRTDEAVARSIDRRTTGPAADRFWRLLSGAADHGKLWFAAAGVLVALGKPRAAARGLVSLGVASLVANVVGKRLVGGERPAPASIPVARRLDRSPTSPSFPSGHTASAVAFATGVALDAPAAGAALAPLAAGVGYSRLHTGAHWFSDVVGGAAIGAGAAVLVKAVGPALRSLRPVVRPGAPTAQTAELPVLPRGAGAFIVVNPGSGAGLDRPDPRRLLAERFPEARVHELQEGDDIAALVQERLGSAEPPRVLGVSGGDGTVAAMAHEARLAGLPLLVLPGGTFNHFAKAIGADILEVALDAFAAGTGRRVDVAELRLPAGGDGESVTRTVLNTSSVGVYPAFVAERERHQGRWGKPLAAVIAAIRVVRKSTPIELEVDGRSRSVWSVFVGVDRYYPVTVAPIERRRLDDGLLDIRILAAGRKPKTRGAIALAFGGRTDALVARLPFLQGPPVIDGFTAERISLRRRDVDPGYAHDGEASTTTPGDGLELRILPAALAVYAPVSSP
ncbi:bifunctional phosphatase PAP2/diacylglycerol kinase family protein [Leifsonia shinshuensis]|uniref:Undecaprenyl-diphosphatase n=1 Tax=Leifsonia shinshuensis TaxID=150026 RepID=A0A853CTG1_9MICO|nr:bifunctional phosphatase PAP2/diacylglycerol kinase family protein [Leifsonia shinshuensis]NYJ23668.1 undecaprenyl-diphosphatase [Leifsonia shinshuensis]